MFPSKVGDGLREHESNEIIDSIANSVCDEVIGIMRNSREQDDIGSLSEPYIGFRI
ncbi:MAG: hypothetical protein JWL97_3454 [Gemmatimonadales bacterium]|nr:hypothetical protein [Gemmatimonadales bacterium]